MAYHDPHCATIADDGHTTITNLPMHSMPLTASVLENADLVVIVTDHTSIDFALIANNAALVLDTRGVMRNVKGKARVVGLSGGVEHPGGTGLPRRSWAGVSTA